MNDFGDFFRWLLSITLSFLNERKKEELSNAINEVINVLFFTKIEFDSSFVDELTASLKKNINLIIDEIIIFIEKMKIFLDSNLFKTNFMRLNFVLVAFGFLLGILTAIKTTLDGYTLLSIIVLSLLMPLATLNVCWNSYKLIK